MGTRTSHAIAALLGAAVAGTAIFASGGLAPEPAPLPQPEAAGARDQGALEERSAADARALAELSDRVGALQASIAALDHKLSAALIDRTPATTAGGSGGAVVDEATLQRAIEGAQANAERAKFLAMSPGEAIQSARALQYEQKDLAGARRLLEALLERPLEAAQRQETLVELGIAQRTGEDFASSARTLQQALDLAGGPDTEAGSLAAFQLAWTELGRGDRKRARALFEQVGRSRAGGEYCLDGRWNAAKLAAEDGDPRARAEFEAILRVCGDDPAYDYIASDLRARLGLK